MLIIESVPLIPAHPVRFVLEPLEFQPSRHAVPPLAGSAQLAEWLDVPIEWLAWFTDEKGISRGDRLGHYKHRWIPKSSGGARLIQAPKHRLKVMQRKVLHGLLSHVAVHEAAHGCVVGRSARTHAALHQKKRIVALRARLHNARSAAQPIATRDVLLGQIGWIAGESATRRARLMRAFEAITWKSP